MKKIALLAFAFCCFVSIKAQSRYTAHSYLVRGNVQQGLLLPEYAFMSYLTDDYTRGFEVNVLKLTSGKSIWHHLYRFPGFGMSFHYTTLGSKEYFGNQYSLYPYFSMNILRVKKFEFNYQMGIGLAYATKKYIPDHNYQNLAIGSNVNIHYHADLIAQYQVGKRLFLNTGIAFSHISNANLSEPNVGLNLCSVYAGVSYAFGASDSSGGDFNMHLDPYFTYEVMIAGGMKHTRTFESFQYPALSVSFDAKRRFGYKFALGVGADFFYDSSIEPQMTRLNMPYASSNSYTSGIHLAQEFIYDRFSFILQEGIYVGLTDKLFDHNMYNRAIARYKFTSHFFAGLSMKSHLFILDFPELGIGYYW